eukprot:TRINITY_DN68068_c3_g2_i4.p1 TRINITY_DN68068_c3_g2~~TRINITY_DN68068_c3_g2_i4.p1  ORF type:complete len:236 (-),score=13.58 TRINITY_DN68068_c3_g2_i4:449-1156(-)
MSVSSSSSSSDGLSHQSLWPAQKRGEANPYAKYTGAAEGTGPQRPTPPYPSYSPPNGWWEKHTPRSVTFVPSSESADSSSSGSAELDNDDVVGDGEESEVEDSGKVSVDSVVQLEPDVTANLTSPAHLRVHQGEAVLLFRLCGAVPCSPDGYISPMDMKRRATWASSDRTTVRDFVPAESYIRMDTTCIDVTGNLIPETIVDVALQEGERRRAKRDLDALRQKELRKAKSRKTSR